MKNQLRIWPFFLPELRQSHIGGNQLNTVFIFSQPKKKNLKEFDRKSSSLLINTGLSLNEHPPGQKKDYLQGINPDFMSHTEPYTNILAFAQKKIGSENLRNQLYNEMYRY